MANSSLSSAKVLLLAVQAATQAEIGTLRSLYANYPTTLRIDIILRILLSYLPETLETSKYSPFLLELDSGQISKESTNPVDLTPLAEINDAVVSKRARKLHLLPLAWPSAPQDAPDDPLILFLIHRAYRIDEQTGLITQLPELLVPFLSKSVYLRTWLISTLLPLLRLNYEYYPQEETIQTIKSFENLNNETAVNLLLSAAVNDEANIENTIGRDLKGLVGPWMYGSNIRKRRRIRKASTGGAQTVVALDEIDVPQKEDVAGWEEVYSWIISQSATSWATVVHAIEQWDGPGDVDLGGYGENSDYLGEEECRLLKMRYARCAIASAYRISEASVESLTGIQRILSRIINLLGHDHIPSLTAAAALLSPISYIDKNGVSPSTYARHLRSNPMEESNTLTSPTQFSTALLHGILISAFLLTRAGVPCTIRHGAELALFQDEKQQKHELQLLMLRVGNGPKGDDKFFIRMRNELLWLQDWNGQSFSESEVLPEGKGVFGKLPRDVLEAEMLKALLANTREQFFLQKSKVELANGATKATHSRDQFTRHLLTNHFHSSRFTI